jgi:hypothetical protein
MDSAELLHPLPASDLSLSLLISEFGLLVLRTPMDSSSIFLWAGSVAVSKTQTHMNSNGLIWTLAASSSFWLELVFTHTRTLTPMDCSGLVFRAGSARLSKTQTPMDSDGLSRTLAATSSFWLELVSTHLWTWTPMNSFGLLKSFLMCWNIY